MSSEGKVDAELQRIDGISNKYPDLVPVPIPINIIQGTVFSKKYRFPITGWHSLRPYKIGIVRGILFAEQQTVGMDRLVLETLFLYHYVHVSRSDLVEKLEPVFRVLRIKS